jgi:hypothetical protein
MKINLGDGIHLFAAFLFLRVIEKGIEFFLGSPTELFQDAQCVFEEEFGRVPFGFSEKVCDGLSGAATAEEFGHFGETFPTGERGNADDGSPEVGEVATADEFSDAFEKPLAKGGKAVYSEQRTFRLCAPGNGGKKNCKRSIAKSPLFTQEQLLNGGGFYSLSKKVQITFANSKRHYFCH